ncbi:MAG: M24 family metallopeptidase [Candidatus Methylomirabilales bacterium]
MLLNRDRAEGIMRERGLDGLIATTPENVIYLSNDDSDRLFFFLNMPIAALLPRDGLAPCLIVPGTELPYLAGAPSWIEDVRAFGTFYVTQGAARPLNALEERLVRLMERPRAASLVEALAAAVGDRGLEGAHLGLDEVNLTPRTRAALEAALPRARFTDAFEVFREIRMVKTAEELGRLRQAARINQAALHAVLAAARPGATDADLRATYFKTVTELGGVPRMWGSSAGPRSSCFFSVGQEPLQPGDLIRLDVGCRYQHYFADMARTAVVGEATAEQRRCHAAIRAGVQAACERVRPGVKVSELYDVCMATIRRSGLPDFARHHCGHSIGLELYEPPMVVGGGRTSDIFAGGPDRALEPGMLLSIEAPLYHLGFGGMNVEDSLLVTAAGAEWLTSMERELVQV